MKVNSRALPAKNYGMMSNERIKKGLQRIMNVCNDGAEGYAIAAHQFRDEDLKNLFRHLARQRRDFMEKLQTEAGRAGYRLHGSGTVKGFFHRLWLVGKAWVSVHADERIVEESIMGEKAAIAVYDEVLRIDEMPIHLTNVLEEQEYFIKSAVNRLFELDRDMVYI